MKYRQILSAAMLQHSSKVQPFKQSSLDRIIERILYFTQLDCLSTTQIQTHFFEAVDYNIPLKIFDEAIERLLKSKSIEICTNDDEKYILSEKKKAEIQLINNISDKRERIVINKLFSNSPTNKNDYIEPFFFSISYIFSNIGEYSAKLINGTVNKENVLFPILDNCIEEVKKRFDINSEYFFKRLNYFISELNEPSFNETKCILSQNHFIAKSIGISPDSENFSKELFDNTIIYLDTNILLALVSKNNRKHINAISFINAANKIKLHFKISQITINEYESWVYNEIDRIKRTINQIPQKTKSKIASPVYKDFYEEYLKNEKDAEEILFEIKEKYLEIKNILKDLIPKESIEYIDDEWFDTIEQDKNFNGFVEIVKNKYSEVSSRKKGNNAAKHDAKQLLWLKKISSENNQNFLFVSTDTSLPLIKFENEKSNNINLEAMLQWILPLTNSDTEKETEYVISEFLKQRILPKEFMFEIKDFLIFDELQMQCKELPHEDVENCILYLKRNVSELDTNKASDREIFANEIAKFFLDPSRKYQKELSLKEAENKELNKKLGDVFLKLEVLQKQSELKEKELKKTKDEHEKFIKKIEEEHNKKIGNVLNSLKGVQTELDEIKKEKQRLIISKKLKKWKNPGIYALFILFALIAFGVLELLPISDWNLPAKFLFWINSLKDTNPGAYKLLIGLNLFLLSTLLVTLSAFTYNRLFNKDKIEKKEDYFKNKYK